MAFNKVIIALLLLCAAAFAQQQGNTPGTVQHFICDSGCSGGAGGGGLAQLQVRNAGDTAWINVGINGADLSVPVVLQAGAAVIGHVIVDTAPTTPVTGTFWPYTLGQQLAAASVPIVLTASQLSTLTPLSSISVSNFPGTQPVSITTLPALTTGSAVIGHVINDAGTAVIGHVIVDTAPSTAVTNAGTFATQATLAAETTKVIGTINIAASQTIGLATGSAVIGHVIADTGSTTAVTQATGTNLHAVIDTGSTTAVTGNVTVVQPTPANMQVTATPIAITKGTQGATGFTTQDLKDAGRNRVTFTADRVTPAASDTLVTFVKDVGGTATTAQTTYTVTAAKTLRVQAIHLGLVDSTTTAVSARLALRENTGGACTASSTAAVMLYTATPAAIAAEGSPGADLSIPDGLEFPAADSICISAIASTATGTLTATVVGYEY